ncbi:YbaY family lipoprotein [Pseudodesulfovibrio karagichevae]|uniref:YbaY family lipoprotein n=1 Tax=Pseudodesulfovibrio karagichevae TaxID=3239305 RepID=A0ABV4K6F4_9BACT
MHRTPVLTAPALLAVALILAALGGCTAASTEKSAASVSPSDGKAALKVTVFYRERMLLPPGCVLFVELQNISQLNPEDNGVGNAFLPVKAAPPFKAVLRYDPGRIIAQLHYALSARIVLKGQVLFSGSTRIDPLSWPKDKPVEIQVTMPKR